MRISKPSLSFWQIFNMNVGFLGIQYSFGLQQTAINPIFLFLGAPEDMLPILNIAGPVTGLIVQPIIGALSDKTWSLKWGRRKPYFLIGALLGSICLFMFPHSPVLWFAVGLLWMTMRMMRMMKMMMMKYLNLMMVVHLENLLKTA